MSKTFPTVIISKELSDIQSGDWKIPEPPIEPTIPMIPEKIKFSFWLYAVPVIGYVFIDEEFVNLGVFIIGIFVFLFGIYIYDKINFPKEHDEYILKIKQYERNLTKYNESKSDYENLISKRNDASFNQELFLRYFKNSQTFTKNYTCKKGLVELTFLKTLNEYFPNEIFHDKIIEYFKPSLQYESVNNSFYEEYAPHLYDYGGVVNSIKEYLPYCPDFIFKHQTSNLHIDIEIDEPYAKDKPIHFLYNSHDEKRNTYFLNNRWIIVRFTEEQVVNNRISCCYFIANVIKYFTGDNSYLKKFSREYHLTPIKVWTQKEAEKMIVEKYRHTYLKDFIPVIF